MSRKKGALVFLACSALFAWLYIGTTTNGHKATAFETGKNGAAYPITLVSTDSGATMVFANGAAVPIRWEPDTEWALARDAFGREWSISRLPWYSDVNESIHGLFFCLAFFSVLLAVGWLFVDKPKLAIPDDA